MSDSSIPSLLYYDNIGVLRASGAEVKIQSARGRIGEDWTQVTGSHFYSIGDEKITLPRGKTVVDVFADFLAYLYRSTKIFIEQSFDGSPWRSLEENIKFVLCHPDGLQSSQIRQMERAVQFAGLSAGSSVTLVTSGEAGLHFCLRENIISSEELGGRAIGILNTGALATDMGIYSLDVSPGRIVELAPPLRILQGSSSVTSRAQAFLTGKRFNVARSS
jgi:hypothetical protein